MLRFAGKSARPTTDASLFRPEETRKTCESTTSTHRMAPGSTAEPALRGSLDEANERYEAIKSQLKEGLERKRQTDRDLTDLESQIYLYEGSYLNSTALSGGNVIRGFESYMKAGTTGAGNVRAPSSQSSVSNEDRMFSTSSATHQRSLTLKMNEAAEEASRPEESKGVVNSSQSSGYKLKRKT